MLQLIRDRVQDYKKRANNQRGIFQVDLKDSTTFQAKYYKEGKNNTYSFTYTDDYKYREGHFGLKQEEVRRLKAILTGETPLEPGVELRLKEEQENFVIYKDEAKGIFSIVQRGKRSGTEEMVTMTLGEIPLEKAHTVATMLEEVLQYALKYKL